MKAPKRRHRVKFNPEQLGYLIGLVRTFDQADWAGHQELFRTAEMDAGQTIYGLIALQCSIIDMCALTWQHKSNDEFFTFDEILDGLLTSLAE